MAAATIVSRETFSHGSLKGEIIEFTDDTTSTYAIKTKLGRVVWFVIQGVAGSTPGAVNNVEAYINSQTASTTEDDPGYIFVNSGATSGGSYSLLALGK